MSGVCDGSRGRDPGAVGRGAGLVAAGVGRAADGGGTEARGLAMTRGKANAMSVEKSVFERLAAVNVGQHTEKKNGLSYLSWAWAWDQLLRQDPNADYGYLEPKVFANDTVMVYCTVTAFGKARTAHLPVMDHRNKAIPSPDAFAMNTAMQRVLVKAIALHGLGLYIYAGEDLPLSDADAEADTPKAVAAAPDGFEKWVLDLEAVADNGTDALKLAWKQSQPYMRKHLTDTNNAQWEALKAKADKVPVAAA